MKSSRSAVCHVCESRSLRLLEQAHSLLQVTSDCRPWPVNGAQAVCLGCGTVIKVIDQAWRDNADRIYRDYSLYQVSSGAEQKGFDASGKGLARSILVTETLKRAIRLPTKGTLLDLGYGTGAFFRAFHNLFPKWDMYGVEIDDKNARFVTSLPGVSGVCTSGERMSMLGRFDVVSLIHVLEHIEAPKQFLEGIAPRISKGGVLAVQVPDLSQNPFDLLVADHASHFTPATLKQLLQEAGYEIIEVTRDAAPREILAMARPAQSRKPLIGDPIDHSSAEGQAKDAVSWVYQVASEAKSVANRAPQGGFGLFGTAIAASWMTGLLGDKVAFFVDEDLERVGRSHLGLPVYSPQEVPTGSSVYFCLPMPLALAVHDRLAAQGVPWRGWVPPKF